MEAVDSVSGIMKGAQKVPSRIRNVRDFIMKAEVDKGNSGDVDEMVESLLTSRKFLIRKCSQKVTSSFPKLSIAELVLEPEPSDSKLEPAIQNTSNSRSDQLFDPPAHERKAIGQGETGVEAISFSSFTLPSDPISVIERDLDDDLPTVNISGLDPSMELLEALPSESQEYSVDPTVGVPSPTTEGAVSSSYIQTDRRLSVSENQISSSPSATVVIYGSNNVPEPVEHAAFPEETSPSNPNNISDSNSKPDSRDLVSSPQSATNYTSHGGGHVVDANQEQGYKYNPEFDSNDDVGDTMSWSSSSDEDDIEDNRVNDIEGAEDSPAEKFPSVTCTGSLTSNMKENLSFPVPDRELRSFGTSPDEERIDSATVVEPLNHDKASHKPSAPDLQCPLESTRELRSSRLRTVYYCVKCHKSYSTQIKLEEHLQASHGNDEDSESSNSSFSEGEQDNASELDISGATEEGRVDEAVSGFKDEEEVMMSNDTKVSLPQGDAIRKNSTGLAIAHYPKTVDTKPSALNQRFGYKSKSDPRRCQVKSCLKRFATAEACEIHSRSHGEFSCEFCSNVYDYAPDLAWHEMMEHSNDPSKIKLQVGSKVLPCPRPNCSYSSGDKVDYIEHHLAKHLQLQVNAPSYTCEICNKVFHCKQYEIGRSQRKHYNTHHNLDNLGDKEVQKCDQKDCPAYFVHPYQLLRHKQRAHEIKPFVCQLCGEKYAHRHNLRNHVNSKHGDQVKDIPRKFTKVNVTSRKGVKRKRAALVQMDDEDSASTASSGHQLQN